MTQRQTSRGSLFAAMSEGIASQEQSARMQRLEIALGFLGFFVLVSFITTVVAILQGRPAVVEALVLALFVGLGWYTLRKWQAAGRAVAADAARRGRELPH